MIAHIEAKKRFSDSGVCSAGGLTAERPTILEFVAWIWEQITDLG